MNQKKGSRILCRVLVPVFLLSLLTPWPLMVTAETWTDVTGKFKIEAEYIGVKGQSIVLKLADGATREVPIARLDASSRARAKQLHDAAKANVAPPDAKPAAMPALAARPATTSNPFSGGQADYAPDVPPVAELPSFPDNQSLQQTVDFVIDQALAGHPEVFWYALPADLRAELDSVEVRQAMRPGVMMQVEAQQPMRAVADSICEILIRKKTFVLGTPSVNALPPTVRSIVQSLYDPASGLIYEVSNCLFASEQMMEHSIEAWANHFGPRIGGHLKQLIEAAPPGMIANYRSQVVVVQADDTTGTVTIPTNGGATKTIEMVSYEGRWMPKDFVSEWASKKGTMADGLRKQFAEGEQALQNSRQQMQQSSAMIAALANQFLQPLKDADTQQKFDAAVTQALISASGFAGPGLVPGPGAAAPGFGN